MSPSVDVDAIDSTPMPYLPASVMPDGLMLDATAIGIVSCRGRICSAASFSSNQSLWYVKRSPREQPHAHADGFVLPVAEQVRRDAVRARVGRKGAGAGAEDDPPAGHVVELHDALADVERVVIRQRHDAGAEADALRALAGGREEQLGRGDHLPAGRVVLAHPELVVAELVEERRELEVTLQQQARVLAERMVRSQEGAEAQA